MTTAENAVRQEKPRLLQLQPRRMRLASDARNDWVVDAEHGSTKEDIFKPEYWAHVGVRLQPYDEITVRADDGSFWARFLVARCDRTWADVRLLTWVDLSMEVTNTAAGRYRVEWGGPYDKWRIARNSDNSIVEKALSKVDAIMRCAELEKSA